MEESILLYYPGLSLFSGNAYLDVIINIIALHLVVEWCGLAWAHIARAGIRSQLFRASTAAFPFIASHCQFVRTYSDVLHVKPGHTWQTYSKADLVLVSSPLCALARLACHGPHEQTLSQLPPNFLSYAEVPKQGHVNLAQSCRRAILFPSPH
jgi:hypothetical protein